MKDTLEEEQELIDTLWNVNGDSRHTTTGKLMN